MNLVVICIYNREENLKHWLHCWNQCNKNAELIVIHNHYNEPGLKGKFKEICKGVTYIPRSTGGYDIGAFQDFCSGKLIKKDWNKLLWITDDTWPMAANFTDQFFNQLIEGIGCVAMEISPYVRRHVRTTGFAITKKVAEKLTFPANPVTTKEDCYKFEHRSEDHLLAQVERMGLKAIMVAPQNSSPLFDTGYGRRLKHRIDEHYKIFGDKPTIPNFSRQTLMQHEPQHKGDGIVSIICPIYDKYPQIISSLLCQTYTKWQLHLVHDGPEPLIDLPDDVRITYEHIPRIENDFGHTIRAKWLQKVNTEFVIITNPDNYYMPVFIERAIEAMKNNYIAVYCNQIIHNYTNYKVMDCRLQRGFIDCGQVMLRAKESALVGWKSKEHSADWFFFADIITKYGANKFIPFKGCLFVHN